jgi:cytochrome o ubiquinol oxidase subunit 2
MKRYQFLLLVLIGLLVMFGVILFLGSSNIALLNPKGLVALKERNLIITAILLMALVILPFYIFTFVIAWKYRAGNTKTTELRRGRKVIPEFVWWLIPSIVVVMLAAVTWQATHALDPKRPLASAARPITIQVVALNWKWLFIYPEQNMATVNFIEFPAETPLHFELTADAPMNSFWIPELGGQIYAMAGMTTQINLMADAPGEFPGSATEINGQGFAGMRFIAKATSQSEFDAWVASARNAARPLTSATYAALAKPSESNAVAYYSEVAPDLVRSILFKYAPTIGGNH